MYLFYINNFAHLLYFVVYMIILWMILVMLSSDIARNFFLDYRYRYESKRYPWLYKSDPRYIVGSPLLLACCSAQKQIHTVCWLIHLLFLKIHTTWVSFLLNGSPLVILKTFKFLHSYKFSDPARLLFSTNMSKFKNNPCMN